MKIKRSFCQYRKFVLEQEVIYDLGQWWWDGERGWTQRWRKARKTCCLEELRLPPGKADCLGFGEPWRILFHCPVQVAALQDGRETWAPRGFLQMSSLLLWLPYTLPSLCFYFHLHWVWLRLGQLRSSRPGVCVGGVVHWQKNLGSAQG